MKIVSGLFETYQEADTAVMALNADGYNNQNMSIMGQAEVLQRDHEPDETAETAGKGAGVGGIVGLIAGVAPLAIPGIGPIVGAGSIIGGLISGAGIGAAIGGLAGVFKKLFGDTDHIEKVERSLEKGHILVAVETSDTGESNVTRVLKEYGAYDVHAHEREASRAS